MLTAAELVFIPYLKQLVVMVIALVLLAENHKSQFSVLGNGYAGLLAALSFSPVLMVIHALITRWLVARQPPYKPSTKHIGTYALVLAANALSVALMAFK